jgi:hypothetical protein
MVMMMNNFFHMTGKTIVSAEQKTIKGYDDEGFLELKFSDGQTCAIISDYGGYTGNSRDEYKTKIKIFWVPFDELTEEDLRL